jgi:hypothetical protein
MISLALLTGCSGTPASGIRTSAELSAEAATDALTHAIAALRGARAVHIDVHVTTGPDSAVYSEESASDVGYQVITANNGGQATVIEVNGIGYLKANLPALVGFLGISTKVAQPVTGRWIAFDPGDLGYQRVVSGVTLGSVADELALGGRVISIGRSKVAGQAVIGLRGAVPPIWNARMGGSATLYVAAAGLPLPVSFRATTEGGGETATFSQWGTAVQVTAPTDTVPAGQIMSSYSPPSSPGAGSPTPAPSPSSSSGSGYY